jgi:2,5-diamino-6-(ribosylamino)-4(3H)-pyrimidinone 5'-phosphate reductase
MSKDRTFNTLFMLSSLDGKISTGDVDTRDIDKDFPKIKGVREGLAQYYQLEQSTDLHSLNTGRVMAKIGMNKKKDNIKKLPVSFIIIDNKPHLNSIGIHNLLEKCKTLYLITNNKKHPAYNFIKQNNIRILYYPKEINFTNLFTRLKRLFHIKRITIQSGGTLNSSLLRKGLIDEVSIVVAPALVGGKNTSTIIDGKSLRLDKEIRDIRPLKLKRFKVLKNSYIHLLYTVLN